jgi:predicted dinucleotide-binding enzyme
MGGVTLRSIADRQVLYLTTIEHTTGLPREIAELGDHARAATPAEAAQAGDLVVATVPLARYEQLSAEALAGKIVIDTMNYYYQRDGRIDEVEERVLTSSEMVQRVGAAELDLVARLF